ncbi:MAG: hypothetical protein FIA96_05440 [Betaproteobacteria bacterium]|nr:hypothetical protein [Betaproteobacteria bacterium]
MLPFYGGNVSFCQLSGILFIGLMLAGCVPAVAVHSSTHDELDKVKSGRLALVLLQIKTMIDGKLVSPIDPGDSNKSLRLYLASLSDPRGPQRIQAASPSEVAAAEGWRQMLLPPGTYFMLALPPGVEQNPPAVAFHLPSARFGRLTEYKFEPGRGGFWSPELMAFELAGAAPQGFREIPGFWFQVPEGKPVVYIGTLSTVCTGGRGLFGSLIDSCSDHAITLDQNAARNVGATALSWSQGVDTEPLVLYGKARDGARLRDPSAISIAVADSPALDTSHIGARIAPWGVIHGTGRAIGIYNLLAIASKAATESTARQQADQRATEVQGCIQRISVSLQGMDYAAQFASALAETARTRETATDLNEKRAVGTPGQEGDVPQRLAISIPILRLRESVEPQYLGLELGLHVSLEAGESRRVAYDSLLLYAEGFPAQNPLTQTSRLYERLVPERAQPRHISEWCSSNGEALLRDEIGAGLKYLAAQLVRDLE